jgi:rRNA maturation endonuclease Nob1
MIKIFKIHCNSCKSELDIHHEMDSHQYDIEFCPFCGEDIDEDEVEFVDEIETE